MVVLEERFVGGGKSGPINGQFFEACVRIAIPRQERMKK